MKQQHPLTVFGHLMIGAAIGMLAWWQLYGTAGLVGFGLVLLYVASDAK